MQTGRWKWPSQAWTECYIHAHFLFMYFLTEKLSIYEKSTEFSILPSAPRYENSIILILYNALGRKWVITL